MLKLAGAVLICLCGYCVGYIKAYDIRKRVYTLAALTRCVAVLEKSIVFEKQRLFAAFSELGGEKYIGAAFSDTADNMRSCGVDTAWHDAVSRHFGYLTADERDAVLFLCGGIGKSDSDGERRHLLSAETLLKKAEAQARTEYGEKAELYKKCGILAAVFVTLVML